MGFLTGSGLGVHKYVSDKVKELNKPLIRTKNIRGIVDWDNTPEINIVEQIIWGTFFYGSTLNITYSPIEESIGTNGCSITPFPLTKEIIYTRLAVINSLFFTQAEMGCFILQDMTENIWKACEDIINKRHTDTELVRKAEEYIELCLQKQDVSQHSIQKLLDTSFHWKLKTYKKTGTYAFESVTQLSLLTKYLHYLLEMANSKRGFPIWDKLLKEGILEGKSFSNFANNTIDTDYKNKSNDIIWIFIRTAKRTPNSTFPDYVCALDSIKNALKVSGFDNWSDFHILDRFLWAIAKVADAKYVSSQNTNMPQQAQKTITYNMAKLHMLMTKAEFDKLMEYYQDTEDRYQPKLKGVPMTQKEFDDFIITFCNSNHIPYQRHVITALQDFI